MIVGSTESISILKNLAILSLFGIFIMRRKKGKLNQNFDPEKYRMISCPSCGGTGKSSEGGEGTKVCSQCGGFGWVKREGDQT